MRSLDGFGSRLSLRRCLLGDPAVSVGFLSGFCELVRWGVFVGCCAAHVNDVVSPAVRLKDLFSQDPMAVNKTTGNLIRRSEKETTEDGDRIHIYYWFVGGIVPPKKVC